MNTSVKTKLSNFFKKETVLCIAAVLALISAFIVPPSTAYIGYINFSTLAMLFSLMSVVAGMRAIGVFDLMSSKLLSLAHGFTSVTLILVLLCFFLSMFLTNDVALVTLVPFTILVFAGMGMEHLLLLPLVMETVAANLGSMMLPFGNPQNLFLYSFYEYDMASFIRLVAPYTAVSLVLVVLITVFGTKYVLGKCSRDAAQSANSGSATNMLYTASANTQPINKPLFFIYLALFLLSISSVAHLIDWRIAFAIVLVVIAIVDRSLFTKVDYSLLVTFVFFFIFIGNLGNIEAVQSVLASVLIGREVPVAVITSQFASNVPAAILLSGFTDNGAGLIIGTNLGGLGTLIASMASLITYKFFSEKCPNRKGKYLLVFTAINVGMLVVLMVMHSLIK